MYKLLSPIVALFCSALFLTGCGSDAVITTVKSIFTLQPAKVWLEKVHIKAADNVNDGSPVTVHLLIVYKADLLAELAKLDADTYFQKIEQIKIDNPDQLDIFSWDVIRGQRISDIPITPSKLSGEGILVFAHYSSPGPHRAAIGPDHEVIIQLDKKDFTVTPVKPE